jgi:hypothetical protein
MPRLDKSIPVVVFNDVLDLVTGVVTIGLDVVETTAGAVVGVAAGAATGAAADLAKGGLNTFGRFL